MVGEQSSRENSPDHGSAQKERNRYTGVAGRMAAERPGREREIQRAIDEGNLEQVGDWLRVPQSRWLKLDGIVRDLF